MLISYPTKEKCFKSMPDEVRRGIEEAAANLKSNSNLIYVCDRGFDDRKVFEKVTELDESFVIRVYKDRKFDGGRKLKEVSESIASLEQYTAKMKVRGSYCDVPIYFGYTHVSIGGTGLTLVVSPRSCPKKSRQVAFAYQPTRKLARRGQKSGRDLQKAADR